jgi:hypothetical protein
VNDEPGAPVRKLAQALGLAVAAPALLAKVRERVVDPELLIVLSRMTDDALLARDRCVDMAELWGAADEVVALAHTYEDKAAATARAWIRPATTALERAEVLAMAEAGEVATWQSLADLGDAVGDGRLRELARWGLGVQRAHLRAAFDLREALVR